ncbi:MAG: Ppx/GppA family phosphatase [Actinomycetota bacterium]|nr:MAG: Ppx/GppA family phosphatase [Actinomycetota bacterium]
MSTSPEPPATLAALDLGTNSFHLLVARLTAEGGFEVIAREKEMVRLGHGGGDMKALEAEAVERGIAALGRMKRIADSFGAPVRAVATSAVREATNAEEFTTRAREAGVEVEVISGIEEARLIHLGVLQAVPAFDRRLLLVDIGGGSTEVLVGEHGETLLARSFKLGSVRLTDRFFPGARLHPSAVSSCRKHVRSSLAVIEREVADVGHDLAVASSGTAEATARMVLAARGGDEPRTFNCFEFTTAELKRVVQSLAKAQSVTARRRVPGLDAGRADIVLAGALILEGVADTFGISGFTFSEYALREGVLLDTIGRMQGRGAHELRDVARRSVRQLAERCDDDVRHSAHICNLALQLYDATQLLHGLDDASRDLLEAAALLANVGLVISHSKHHLHSYYVIRNSELVGFTDREIELIALVARYHRKSAPKPSHAEFAQLAAEDQRRVKVLAGVLRVAIGLDRSHDGRVQALVVTRNDRTLRIEVVAGAGTDTELEVYAASERTGLLAEVLDVGVEVTARP